MDNLPGFFLNPPLSDCGYSRDNRDNRDHRDSSGSIDRRDSSDSRDRRDSSDNSDIWDSSNIIGSRDRSHSKLTERIVVIIGGTLLIEVTIGTKYYQI